MDKQEYIKLRLNEAIQSAQGILDGSLDPIIGFRSLVSISHDFEGVNEFDVFVGLDSETDEFPRGDVRKKYSKSYLDRLDKEAEEYLDESNQVINDACKFLIDALETKDL